MQTTTIVLDTGSRYDIVRRSALPFNGKSHMYPDYQIHLVGFSNENLSQIVSAATLHSRFGNAVHKTVFLVLITSA